MDKKKILKIVFIVLFLSFIIAYVIEKSGYYEYNLRNKTVLTKESMEKFEKDVSEGRDVSIEDYVVNTSTDYTTKLTRGTNKVSTKVNDVLKAYFESINIELVDFKIEFGKTPDGQIILADEISPDTCRLWDATTHEKLDKDRFRRDMGNVEEAYAEVFKRLGL